MTCLLKPNKDNPVSGEMCRDGREAKHLEDREDRYQGREAPTDKAT
jgi:hypothetical protein